MIVFLADYRGWLTAEQFHKAGDIAEYPPAVAAQLVADGRAEFVEAEAETPELPQPVRRGRRK